MEAEKADNLASKKITEMKDFELVFSDFVIFTLITV